jgi:hypothetical protein
VTSSRCSCLKSLNPLFIILFVEKWNWCRKDLQETVASYMQGIHCVSHYTQPVVKELSHLPLISKRDNSQRNYIAFWLIAPNNTWILSSWLRLCKQRALRSFKTWRQVGWACCLHCNRKYKSIKPLYIRCMKIV